MLRLRSVVVPLLLVVSFSSWAEPPPDDVKAILEKLKKGKPLDAAEQERLRSWKTGSAESSTGGTMPDDIAAILQKAQTGVPPTPQELERIRAWKSTVNKGQLLDGAKQETDALRNAMPSSPGPKAASPFLDGEVVIEQTRIVRGVEECDGVKKATTATALTRASGKVRFRTREPGKPLDFLAKAPSGPFSLLFELLPPENGEAPRQAMVTTTAVACESSSRTEAVPLQPVAGEFLFGAGPRTYASLPGFDTVDQLRLDLAWQATAGLGNLAQSYGGAVKQAMAQLPKNVRTAIDQATFTLDAKAVRAALTSRGNSADPIGVYHYHLTDVEQKTEVDVTTRVTLRFRAPEPKLKMMVVDAGGAPNVDTWKQWIPWPWLDAAEDARLFEDARAKDPKAPAKRHDLSVAARVRLQFADGTKCKLKVALNDVSRHSGVATNMPGPVDRLTMIIPFEPAEHVNEDWVVASDGQSAETKTEVSSATVSVVSLETAAWAEVVGRCPAQELEATFEPTGLKVIDLPRDDQKNRVADQWEEENGGWRSSGRWDEEPQNDMQHPGDGISLYEEYRGFVFNKDPFDPASVSTFRRLSPEKKEFFITNRLINPVTVRASARGLRLFQRLTGLEILNTRARYLQQLDKHKERKYPSWVNPFTPRELFAQHDDEGPHELSAMPLVEDQPDRNPKAYAHTEGESDEAHQARGPRDIFWVAVYPTSAKVKLQDAIKNELAARDDAIGKTYEKWCAARKLKPDEFYARITNALDTSKGHQLIEDMLAFSLAHEFVHVLGVPHHGNDPFNGGDIRCPARYFQDDRWVLSFLLGDWNLDEALVPPSFQNSLTYDFDAIDCGKDYCDAAKPDFERDFSTPSKFPTMPWAYCPRCMGKMRLWYSNQDMHRGTEP